MSCSTGLLNKSLSTFTVLCRVSAYGSCVLPNCPTAGGQHAAESPSCHLLARLYLSTWEGRLCFSAALSVCIPCATRVPVNYQVLWHTFLMTSQVFSKICFGPCCPAARNSYRTELGGQTQMDNALPYPAFSGHPPLAAAIQPQICSVSYFKETTLCLLCEHR